MDSGKLKTAVILILLLVNAAFGWILMTQRKNEADLQAQTRSELVQVMAGMGVAMDEGILPREISMRKYTLTRDMALETTLVQAFLGAATGRDMGGNIHYYENVTQREYVLLQFLATSVGTVFSRETLMQKVWNYDYWGDTRSVDVAVRRLREKLEDDPANPTLLCTRRGAGYYLSGN